MAASITLADLVAARNTSFASFGVDSVDRIIRWDMAFVVSTILDWVPTWGLTEPRVEPAETIAIVNGTKRHRLWTEWWDD
jgi:hypothetical protein